MKNDKLRGTSRRQFMKGAAALGAMMGWGPSKLFDFMAQAGLANAAEGKPTMKLVTFIGSFGAHGYMHFLFPQPDTFTDSNYSLPVTATSGKRWTLRSDNTSNLAAHFVQPMNRGGKLTNFTAAQLPNVGDYAAGGAGLPSRPSNGVVGSWSQGERFKRLFGIDNMAFRGFSSRIAASRAIDKDVFGLANEANKIPSNADSSGKDGRIDPAKNFLVVTRETPWLKHGIRKAITSVDGGIITPFNLTTAQNLWIDNAGRKSIFAAAATIQSTIPTVTPVIIVENNLDLSAPSGIADIYSQSTMPGSPTPARVGSADGMINLFNSNAARAAGALANPENAVLFEAYTKGFIGNSKTASLPTFTKGYRTNKLASNLVGLNLSEKLRPTSQDQARYGFNSSFGLGADFRDSAIVAAKALKLGLTAQVVLNYFGGDPHGMFSSASGVGINAAESAAYFGNILEAFMDDLMNADDPHAPGYKLGDNVVFLFLGDAPRTALAFDNWNDPTTGGQNRAWIMGNGLLRTGFFGGERVASAGTENNDQTARGPGEGGLFDPKTGDLISWDYAGSPAQANGVLEGLTGRGDVRQQYCEMAMAAVLFAITRGDMRRVQDFYKGPDIPALVVPQLI